MYKWAEETAAIDPKTVTKEDIRENAYMVLIPKGDENLGEVFRQNELDGKLVTKDVAPDIMVAYALEREINGPSGEDDQKAAVHAFVTKDMLKTSGVTEGELHDAAMENTRRGYMAMPIEQAIRRLTNADGMEQPQEQQARQDSTLPMIVLTNQTLRYGAAAVLVPEAQQEVSEAYGGSFLVCPSSRHEVICIPDEMKKIDYYEKMVIDINRSTVSESDFLSNTILRYDSDSKILEPARDYAGRQAAAEIPKSPNKGETRETRHTESPYPGLPPCPEPRRIEQKRGMDIC